ncbi:hypothetical protein PoB_001092600 [Plakobranchus ocellatus]|uniref:Uncharacterized protein n=1 Tax=Plakobranchus ocellatus TaxID=259542 RepID=A0AAV3YMB8_9GAST|nr:hypothetical protein PoB_001092600 [Plakobranchus ocellatus]
MFVFQCAVQATVTSLYKENLHKHRKPRPFLNFTFPQLLSPSNQQSRALPDKLLVTAVKTQGVAHLPDVSAAPDGTGSQGQWVPAQIACLAMPSYDLQLYTSPYYLDIQNTSPSDQFCFRKSPLAQSLLELRRQKRATDSQMTSVERRHSEKTPREMTASPGVGNTAAYSYRKQQR